MRQIKRNDDYYQLNSHFGIGTFVCFVNVHFWTDINASHCFHIEIMASAIAAEILELICENTIDSLDLPG